MRELSQKSTHFKRRADSLQTEIDRIDKRLRPLEQQFKIHKTNALKTAIDNLRSERKRYESQKMRFLSHVQF